MLKMVCLVEGDKLLTRALMTLTLSGEDFGKDFFAFATDLDTVEVDLPAEVLALK